jgi:membrane protease YdiL (CAAX protease family)
MQETVETRPPFMKSEWSATGCGFVGCLSYALFAVAQAVAFVVVMLHAHPDLVHMFQQNPPSSDLVDNIQRWTVEISTAQNLFWFAVVGDGFMIVFALIFASAFLDARGRQLGLGVPTTAAQIWFGLFAGLMLVFIADIVSAGQAKVFGSHPEAVAEILKTHKGLISFVFDFLAVGVIAPFAEELLFRGVIFAGLAQRLPLWWAAIFSGIIFGAAHLDPWSIVPLAVVGTGLALLYRRTGSLWPNIIAHGAFNTFALVLVYLFPKLAT